MVVFHVMLFSLDLLSRSMQLLLLVERLTSYFDHYWLQLGKLFDGCQMCRRQKRQTFPRVVLPSAIQTTSSYSYWLKKVFCSKAKPVYQERDKKLLVECMQQTQTFQQYSKQKVGRDKEEPGQLGEHRDTLFF